MATKYVLYNFDADTLVMRDLFDKEEEAVDIVDSYQLNDVIALPLTVPDTGKEEAGD